MSQPRDSSVNRFNTMVHQTVMAIGQETHIDILRRNVQSLSFIQVKSVKTLADVDRSAQFLVAVMDFTNGIAVQNLARFLGSVENFAGAKLIFAINPANLTNEELLFGVELGIKRTIFGVKRDEDIRAYIKQRAIEVMQNGGIAFMENEVMKGIGRHDTEGLRLLQDQLLAMDRKSEDVNRLLSLVCEERRDYKRMVFHLKQTLVANPQNLWAANTLGRHYIRNRQVAEGIEILSKLSHYHERNSDRLLALGEAYLNAGRKNEAEAALKKGDALTGGQDQRFSEGLAKIDVIKGDTSAALKRISSKYLSPQILSFLNTRAVMCVRNNSFDEGQKLYDQALSGCDPEQNTVMSKIYFNQGLAHMRSNDPYKAEKAFDASVKLGGAAFDRAVRPLAIAKQIIAKNQKGIVIVPFMDSAEKDMDDFQWETLGGF